MKVWKNAVTSQNCQTLVHDTHCISVTVYNSHTFPAFNIWWLSVLSFSSNWPFWAYEMSLISWILRKTSSNGNIFRVTGILRGEFTGHRWIPRTRPVTRSFDVFFDLRLNKRLSKQSRDRWSETPPRSLWRQSNDMTFTNWYNERSVRRHAGHKAFQAFYGDLHPFIQQSLPPLIQVLIGIIHISDAILILLEKAGDYLSTVAHSVLIAKVISEIPPSKWQQCILQGVPVSYSIWVCVYWEYG